MKSEKRRDIQKKKNAKRAARDAALTSKGRKKTAEYAEGGGNSRYAQKQKMARSTRSPIRYIETRTAPEPEQEEITVSDKGEL